MECIHQWRNYCAFPIIAESISLKDCLLLAGKRWSIIEINDEAKSISVIPDKRKGSVPVGIGEPSIHTKIRQKMKEIYSSEIVPKYLDPQAKEFLRQARTNFHEMGLHNSDLCKQPISQINWFPWAGSKTMTTLRLLIELFSGNAPTINKGELSISCALSDLKKTSEEILEHSEEELRKKIIKYFNDHRPGIFRSASKKWLWLVPDEIAGEEFIDDQTNISEAMISLESIGKSIA